MPMRTPVAGASGHSIRDGLGARARSSRAHQHRGVVALEPLDGAAIGVIDEPFGDLVGAGGKEHSKDDIVLRMLLSTRADKVAERLVFNAYARAIQGFESYDTTVLMGS